MSSSTPVFATEHQGMGQRTKETTTAAVSEEEAAIDDFVELLVRHSKDYALAMPAADVKVATLEWLARISETADTENVLPNSIFMLSKVFGIMTNDKLGNAKTFEETLHFMRRCAGFRETVMWNKRDTATERDCDADGVSACYRACANDLLQNDLLPRQLKDTKYYLRWDASGDATLTTFQRSFVDNILRKRLGNKKWPSIYGSTASQSSLTRPRYSAGHPRRRRPWRNVATGTLLLVGVW